jgi:hypothetical protein
MIKVICIHEVPSFRVADKTLQVGDVIEVPIESLRTYLRNGFEVVIEEKPKRIARKKDED